MKVSDVMQKKVEFVSSETSVADVSRLIFGRGINGLPVLKNKKLVGFITEKDILTQFYPSMDEFIEDPVHSGDFEEMEKKTVNILSLDANKIMSKNPVSVTPETPLLKAQSIMFLKKIGRLPVVDKSGKLVGILSKGDIFRAVVGFKLPMDQEESFFDWMARFYDEFINWNKRLLVEIPELISLLKANSVKALVDVGASTGEHCIALAKNGLICYGLDASKLMFKRSELKKNSLPKNLQSRIRFIYGNYQDTVYDLPEKINAAIFMGNALPHVMDTDKDVIEDIAKVLDPEKAIMVFQILNIDRIIKNSNGFRNFTMREEKISGAKRKMAFLTFYSKNQDSMVVNRSVYECDNYHWLNKGMHSKPVISISKEQMTRLLNKAGFKKIQFFGGVSGGKLFQERYDPDKSEWMNVIAKR